MAAELGHLLEAIPHDQLALQWDTNFEFGLLESHFPAWFPHVEAGVVERLLRISAPIPPDVELGFHFCHGHDEDAEQRIPADMSRMVEIANALAGALARPVNWIHMPLARNRTDAAFVKPLSSLRLHAETELYLGGTARRRRRGSCARAHRGGPLSGRRVRAGHAVRLGPAPAGARARPARAHADLTRPVADPDASRGYVFAWPAGFERIPDEDWVSAPVDTFGLHYDTVENHGWYRNLDLTVEQLAGDLQDGRVLIDYSGGTGILLDRLLLRIFDRQAGVVIVDSSPKFLRVAVDKFRGDARVAFRRLRYLKDERRLQYVDEVLPEPQADVIVSTNAIHLYDDLGQTLRAWARVLRPGGVVRINSGNLRNPRARENEWIIDETVYVVHEVAAGLVRTDERYEAYRSVLEEPERLQRYLDWRDRVFLAPRPLDYYVDALQNAGFSVDDVTERTIEAGVEDWFEFLSAYADAVLGWVGGSAKVDGTPATEAATADRRELLRRALDVIFGGRPSFRCCWTYIGARRD